MIKPDLNVEACVDRLLIPEPAPKKSYTRPTVTREGTIDELTADSGTLVSDLAPDYRNA